MLIVVFCYASSLAQRNGHRQPCGYHSQCRGYGKASLHTQRLIEPGVGKRRGGGQQLGRTGLEPAVFIDASRDEFDPRMDDYLVWRISFTQSAAFGADPFAQLNAPLKAAWLGKAPDIGQAHVDDYQLIYEAKPDE